MSLARTLLNGTTESVDVNGYEDVIENASMEESYFDAAIESFVADIFAIDKAYHVADIMGEVQVLKEGADGQILLEGMIKSGIDKLIAALKKVWAKIQGWFAQVKKFFKSLYLQGKDFVKEFKKEINDKKATGFKYHAFKYDLKGGDSSGQKVMDKVNSWLEKVSGGIAESDRADATSDYMAKNIKKFKGFDMEKTSSDFQDDVVKECGISGASTISELSEELAKIYRSGEDAAEDFEEFESASKDEMMNLVEGVDKQIKEFEKAEKDFEKGVNKVIKALDGVKKESGEAVYKLASKFSSYASALLALGKVPNTVKVAAYKEAAQAYRSILGSFVRFKPVKEGTELEDEEDAKTEDKDAVKESLLEAALRLI